MNDVLYIGYKVHYVRNITDVGHLEFKVNYELKLC